MTTVTFHARDTLGLAPPNTTRLALRTAQQLGAEHIGLTGHWVDWPPNHVLTTTEQVQRLRAIQSEQMGKGYGDISYEGGFDADGNTYGLRDPKWVGAHALSTGNVANIHTDGIVFLNDSRGITPAAAVAWQWWRNLYRLVHGKDAILFAHGWWHHVGGITTVCPGPGFTHLLASQGGKTG